MRRSSEGQTTEGATTEQQDTMGEAAEVVKYGQVMAVNGDEVTVVLGEVGDQPNGDDEGSFTMGQDEITFDRTGVEITDGLLVPCSIPRRLRSIL